MRYVICSLTFAAAMLSGCSASPRMAQADAKSAHAQCLVCKHNADLACVDVAIDSTTPSYTYNGQTYYFCSDECRNHFARQPRKYLAGEMHARNTR